MHLKSLKDTGVTQITSVQVDVLGTLGDLQLLWAEMDRKVEMLAALLKEVRILALSIPDAPVSCSGCVL